MIPRTKAPTPLRPVASSSTNHTAPTLSRDAQQDLTQKNRALENTNARLVQELDREKLALTEERAARAADRLSLLRDMELMEGTHRITHARVIATLEQERASALELSKRVRTEKLARIQRDFAITQFQIKETVLEAKVDELEEELERREEESAMVVEQMREKLERFRRELGRTKDLLAEREKAKEEAKVRLARIITSSVVIVCYYAFIDSVLFRPRHHMLAKIETRLIPVSPLSKPNLSASRSDTMVHRPN
jgi:hypothetical protein